MKLFIFWIAIILFIIVLEPYLFMLLWNWIVPIFWVSAPILTYWQSLGLIILLNVLGNFFKNGK